MLNDKVTKAAFLISFVGHCLFLGMPAMITNSTQFNKPEDLTISIVIEKPTLLPKIDILGDEKKLKEIVEEPKQTEPESESQREEIVMEMPPKKPIEEKIEVINPVQEAMLRYQDMVKQGIEEVRRYPHWAKRQGIEGTVYINFTVLLDGASRDIRIIRTSGSTILDDEAIATIERANPFPPIPKEINSSSVQMEVSIVFTLK